jgi:hypothetical protein
MKWLVLLFLLFALASIIFVRYRRQIQTGLYVWRMFRKMRQAGGAENKPAEINKSATDGELVRCAKCGTWIPKNKALNLRSKNFYCSINCIETAVKV